jgi:DNA-binding MarR family transcriptional regulator
METPKQIINELLVEVFNHILSIEAEYLRNNNVLLSMNEVHVLEAISKTSEPTMSNLAKRLRITVGTLTIAINRLVEKGYVTRYRLSDDKRKVYVSLTHKAGEILDIHNKFHEEMIEETIRDLNLEQDDLLLTALKNLKEYFKNKY